MNLQKSTLAACAALALAAVSTQASAFSTSFTSPITTAVGASSSFAGVTNVTFDSLGLGALSSYAIAGSGTTATYDKGGIYNASIPGTTAKPAGSTGNFWSVGTAAPQLGAGTVAFSTPVKYYGFLWGSSDLYNSVTFSVFDGVSATQYSYTGSAVPSSVGIQSYSSYFNVFASSSEVITGITFSSFGNAFETDNHAFSVTAVPEPETYAMLLAGLGLIGTIARRRNKSKSV